MTHFLTLVSRILPFSQFVFFSSSFLLLFIPSSLLFILRIHLPRPLFFLLHSSSSFFLLSLLLPSFSNLLFSHYPFLFSHPPLSSPFLLSFFFIHSPLLSHVLPSLSNSSLFHVHLFSLFHTHLLSPPSLPRNLPPFPLHSCDPSFPVSLFPLFSNQTIASLFLPPSPPSPSSRFLRSSFSSSFISPLPFLNPYPQLQLISAPFSLPYIHHLLALPHPITLFHSARYCLPSRPLSSPAFPPYSYHVSVMSSSATLMKLCCT